MVELTTAAISALGGALSGVGAALAIVQNERRTLRDRLAAAEGQISLLIQEKVEMQRQLLQALFDQRSTNA